MLVLVVLAALLGYAIRWLTNWIAYRLDEWSDAQIVVINFLVASLAAWPAFHVTMTILLAIP
ncbi:MAG: hypothetical protein ABW128_14875 [Rhizorhabdus sp.]